MCMVYNMHGGSLSKTELSVHMCICSREKSIDCESFRDLPGSKHSLGDRRRSIPLASPRVESQLSLIELFCDVVGVDVVR